MAELDRDNEFLEITIDIAASDENLRRVVGSLLLPEAPECLEDYEDMQDYLKHRYHLFTQDQQEAVFDRCEEQVLEETIA